MPRRSIGPQPMTNAQRKSEQRARDAAAIMELPPSQWPERIALQVLSQSGRYADALRQAAWHRLGELNDWKP